MSARIRLRAAGAQQDPVERLEGEVLADLRLLKEAGLSHPLMAEIEARFRESATPAPAAGGTATDVR